MADLDRRALLLVVAVTNLYAMRFLKAHVRPALTKWMCNTRFSVWKSTSRRWRWRRKLGFHTGNSSTAASARTIRTERTITRPEAYDGLHLLKSKNKPMTPASERADPARPLDQCGHRSNPVQSPASGPEARVRARAPQEAASLRSRLKYRTLS